jgi:glycosyltransferase involved in cell wall biosynthesis
MKILTITVPTYNVEKYLNQCLNSFVVPEIMDELEVLIINDGSTDSSKHIGQKFVDKYPGTFRMISKENGGHGSTINKGIEEACGKYFRVVDGDDWVLSDGLISLTRLLRDLDVDLVLDNYYWVDDLTGKVSTEFYEACPGIEFYTKVPFDNVSDKIFFKMHVITYCTEILRKAFVKIDEHCYYVDMEYMTFPLPYVNSVAAIPDYVYMYRIGQPTQSVTIENMRKRCSQHERVINRLLEYYSANEKASVASKLSMSKIIARGITSQYKIYLSFRENYKDKLIDFEKRLKEQYPSIFKNVTNPAIAVLRLTKYRLYAIISVMVRLRSK